MIELEKKIARKTLDILKKKSFNSISLNEILNGYRNKKINIKSKFDLLKNINNYVDHKLINEMNSLEISSTKDMLFEVLMARFDILELNRKSFLEIYKYLKKKPKYFIKLIPSLIESIIIIAELSKYNINGLKGTVKLKGLFVVYFVTFFQWLDDDNPSLEKTMTALDKYLDQAEKIGKFFL